LSVDLSPEHRALYKKLLKQRILEIDGTVIDAINAQALRMTAMRMVSCPHLFIDTGKTVKNNILDAVETLLHNTNAEQEEKVILACHFRSTVEFLLQHFKHLNPAHIYGGTGNPHKEKDKFIEDPSCRVLIANALSM